MCTDITHVHAEPLLYTISVLLWMEEILHQLIDGLSNDFRGWTVRLWRYFFVRLWRYFFVRLWRYLSRRAFRLRRLVQSACQCTWSVLAASTVHASCINVFPWLPQVGVSFLGRCWARAPYMHMSVKLAKLLTCLHAARGWCRVGVITSYMRAEQITCFALLRSCTLEAHMITRPTLLTFARCTYRHYLLRCAICACAIYRDMHFGVACLILSATRDKP